MKIQYSVVHRECDTDREPIVRELETKFPTLTRFPAIEGTTLTGHPRRHPWESEPTSWGALGNTVSQMELIVKAYQSDVDALCIFEDDAVVVGDLQEMEPLLQGEFDLLAYGINEMVNGTVMPTYRKLNRFWGVHALVIHKKAFVPILNTYWATVQKGYGYPADWIYNKAIEDYKLDVYAPLTDLIVQQKGLLSTISNKIRE